jgi:cytochrome c-type biogenesis protein CcmE
MAEGNETWIAQRPRRRSSTKFVIGGVVLLVAVAYLIFSSVQAQGVYYLTVSEALAGQGGTGQIRVSGKVVPGSIEQDPRTLEARFEIADETAVLPVSYKGVLSDAFVADADVIVEGRYLDGEPFQAKQVLTKCPSKYEASEGEHPDAVNKQ